MFNVLRDCMMNLASGSQPLRGGGVELYDEAERKRIARNNYVSYRIAFWSMGEKFAPFTKRVEHRVLTLQEQVDFYVVKGYDTRHIQSLEELEEAFNEGYVFKSWVSHTFQNPCVEILIDTWTATMPEARVHRYGSPYSSHLNSTQHRLIHRGVWRWLMPCVKDSVLVESLPHIKISKTVLKKLKSLSQNMRVTEMIHWFYNEKKQPGYWQELRNLRENLRGDNNVKLFAEGVAQFILDALGPIKPIKADWKTSEVMGLLRTMRDTEDFTIMPILADALGDAGCDDELLLTHYRNPKSRFSLGSWIFRATGLI
jgi:hypothetical protein